MTKDAGLPCTFVTEDTIRSRPTTLRRLFEAAIEEGADGLCLCDTVGHATPNGVFNLVHFARDIVRDIRDIARDIQDIRDIRDIRDIGRDITQGIRT